MSCKFCKNRVCSIKGDLPCIMIIPNRELCKCKYGVGLSGNDSLRRFRYKENGVIKITDLYVHSFHEAVDIIKEYNCQINMNTIEELEIFNEVGFDTSYNSAEDKVRVFNADNGMMLFKYDAKGFNIGNIEVTCPLDFSVKSIYAVAESYNKIIIQYYNMNDKLKHIVLDKVKGGR